MLCLYVFLPSIFILSLFFAFLTPYECLRLFLFFLAFPTVQFFSRHFFNFRASLFFILRLSITGHRHPKELSPMPPFPKPVIGFPIEDPFNLEDLPIECFYIEETQSYSFFFF